MEQAGFWVLVLAGVVLFGHLWFSLVESVLGRIRRLFSNGTESSSWHPLAPPKK